MVPGRGGRMLRWPALGAETRLCSGIAGQGKGRQEALP